MATSLDLDTPTLVTEDPPRSPTILEPYWEVDDNVQAQMLPIRYGANSYENPDVHKIIVSLLNAEVDCLRTENAEMIRLEWIVAETEIKQILESRLVPESDLQSAGLDPNDPSHFKRCLDNIGEEMMKKQRYDVALSHCQGMKKVFEESNIERLKSFLKLNDLDILKMVFFSKTVMDSPNLVTEDPARPPTIGEPYWVDGHNARSHLLPLRYEADSNGNPEVGKIIFSLLNAEVDCSQTGAREMIDLEWIVAETEIKQILESRLVPESDLQSAGLDPDDPAHFKRCLDNLEEEMIKKQRYDVALSHCQGMKKVFEESNSERLNSFLKLNDLDILKKVFFRSWLLLMN